MDLARILGFTAGWKYEGDVTPISSEKNFDMTSNLNSFYVYCDILEPTLVGDAKVPLLRIVDKTEWRIAPRIPFSTCPYR